VLEHLGSFGDILNPVKGNFLRLSVKDLATRKATLRSTSRRYNNHIHTAIFQMSNRGKLDNSISADQ